jgi:hypothetical protein
LARRTASLGPPDRQVAGSDEPRLLSIHGRHPEFLTAVATPSNRRLTAAARPPLDTITTHERLTRQAISPGQPYPRRPGFGLRRLVTQLSSGAGPGCRDRAPVRPVGDRQLPFEQSRPRERRSSASTAAGRTRPTSPATLARLDRPVTDARDRRGRTKRPKPPRSLRTRKSRQPRRASERPALTTSTSSASTGRTTCS